jgi:hypothetical protein
MLSGHAGEAETIHSEDKSISKVIAGSETSVQNVLADSDAKAANLDEIVALKVAYAISGAVARLRDRTQKKMNSKARGQIQVLQPQLNIIGIPVRCQPTSSRPSILERDVRGGNSHRQIFPESSFFFE